MPNAYLISSEYRGGPSPGKDPSLSINENTSLGIGGNWGEVRVSP